MIELCCEYLSVWFVWQCYYHFVYEFQSESTFFLNVKVLLAQSKHHIWSFTNGVWTRNHLVCKRTLKHLAKLTMIVCQWTKWLWVQILLLSLKPQIWQLLRARCSLTFRQTIDCRFTVKLVCDKIITYGLHLGLVFKYKFGGSNAVIHGKTKRCFKVQICNLWTSRLFTPYGWKTKANSNSKIYVTTTLHPKLLFWQLPIMTLNLKKWKMTTNWQWQPSAKQSRHRQYIHCHFDNSLRWFLDDVLLDHMMPIFYIVHI